MGKRFHTALVEFDRQIYWSGIIRASGWVCDSGIITMRFGNRIVLIYAECPFAFILMSPRAIVSEEAFLVYIFYGFRIRIE